MRCCITDNEKHPLRRVFFALSNMGAAPQNGEILMAEQKKRAQALDVSRRAAYYA